MSLVKRLSALWLRLPSLPGVVSVVSAELSDLPLPYDKETKNAPSLAVQKLAWTRCRPTRLHTLRLKPKHLLK